MKSTRNQFFGMKADMPTTYTTGASYFATDTNTLYYYDKKNRPQIVTSISNEGYDTLQHFIYNPETDKLEADKAIEVTLNSLYLGEQHKMSSGAENIFFTNNSSNIDFFPLWAGVKNQSLPENQIAGEGVILPSGRVYDDFLSIAVNGDVDLSSPSVPYDDETTFPASISGLGIEFYIAESVTAVDTVFLYQLFVEDKQVYEQVLDIESDLNSGDLVNWWFDHPVEIHEGTTISAKVFKADRTTGEEKGIAQVMPTSDGKKYFKLRHRLFSDEDLVLKKDLSQAGIYITNITSAGNINIVYKAEPNEEVVESAEMADLTATVIIEWDRDGGAYEGVPTINGVAVTRTGKIGGNTYVGEADISGSYSEIVAEFAGAKHVVPLEALARPEITNVLFNGNYPNSQSELKAGDVFNIAIETKDNEAYSLVEVQEHNACVYSSHNTSGNISATIANRGNVATERKAKVRVQNTQGTWSLWTETSNTVLCNNLHPSIQLSSKVYPAGQQALKNLEEVEITYSVSNADTDTVSVSPNLTVTTNGAMRASGDYESGTYTIEAVRNANGATATHDEVIRIAHTDVGFSNNSPVQVKSGVGGVKLSCEFDQDLLTSIASPTITADDSDTHSLTVLYEDVVVTNLAGKTVTLDRAYYIKGFAEKTLTLNYPESTANIGTDIVTPADVTVTGILNTTPPYVVCKNRVADISDIKLVADYSLTDISVIINTEICNEFNYNEDNNITVTIKED